MSAIFDAIQIVSSSFCACYGREPKLLRLSLDMMQELKDHCEHVTGREMSGPHQHPPIYGGMTIVVVPGSGVVECADLVDAYKHTFGALEKIIDMNRANALDKYGDADKAEAWACVIVARQGIAGTTFTSDAELERIRLSNPSSKKDYAYKLLLGAAECAKALHDNTVDAVTAADVFTKHGWAQDCRMQSYLTYLQARALEAASEVNVK